MRWLFGMLHRATSQDIILRDFSEDPYNGPKSEDFILRGWSLINATIIVLLKRRDLPDQALRLLKLVYLKAHYKRDIEEKFKLDLAILFDCYHPKKRDPRAVSYFNSKIVEFRIILKNLIKGMLSYVLCAEDKVDSVREEILEEEKRCVARLGRATNVHRFNFPVTSEGVSSAFIHFYVPKGRLTSAQSTAQDQQPEIIRFTPEIKKLIKEQGGNPGIAYGSNAPECFLPSSLRYGEGLVNFLLTGFYTSKQKQLFSGLRSASPTVLGVKGDICRIAKTLRIIEQLLETIIREKLKEENEQEPLLIHLSVLSLLASSILEEGRRDNNERRQIEEIFFALSGVDGKTIPFNVDGRELVVKIDINFMALGCNPSQKYLELYAIRERVNRKGYFDFLKHMFNFLKQHEDIVGQDEFLYKIFEIIRSFFIDTIVVKENRKLEVLRDIQKETDYAEYRKKIMEYEENFSNGLLAGDFSSYRTQVENSYKAGDKIHGAIYSRLCLWWNENEKLYKKYLGKFARREYPKESLHYLIYQILRLFYQANRLFLEKEKLFESEQYYFELQKVYLVISYFIGRIPWWFCKSGKDRTGKLENVILEDLIIYHLMGQFPLLGDPLVDNLKLDESIRDEIAAMVHEYSMSKQIAAANVLGPRVLQIRDGQRSQGLRLGVFDRPLAMPEFAKALKSSVQTEPASMELTQAEKRFFNFIEKQLGAITLDLKVMMSLVVKSLSEGLNPTLFYYHFYEKIIHALTRFIGLQDYPSLIDSLSFYEALCEDPNKFAQYQYIKGLYLLLTTSSLIAEDGLPSNIHLGLNALYLAQTAVNDASVIYVLALCLLFDKGHYQFENVNRDLSFICQHLEESNHRHLLILYYLAFREFLGNSRDIENAGIKMALLSELVTVLESTEPLDYGRLITLEKEIENPSEQTILDYTAKGCEEYVMRDWRKEIGQIVNSELLTL